VHGLYGCALAPTIFDMPHDHHHRLNSRRNRAPHSRAVHAGRERVSRRGGNGERNDSEAGERHLSDWLGADHHSVCTAIHN